MGARFVVVALFFSLAYYGHQFLTHKAALFTALGRMFLFTFLAGGAGKLLGISYHALKTKGFAIRKNPLTRLFM